MYGNPWHQLGAGDGLCGGGAFWDVNNVAILLEAQKGAHAALNETNFPAVIYGGLEAKGIQFSGVDEALRVHGTEIRLFGKPESFKKRRMGVALASGKDTDQARERAKLAASLVKPTV